MIIVILIVPLATSLSLIFMKKGTGSSLSLLISGLTFIMSVIMWAQYDPELWDVQYVIPLYNGIYPLTLGLDGMSLYFIILTTFLFPVCILASSINTNLINNKSEPNILLLVLESCTLAVFIVQDIIQFYIFFEAVLIPLYLLVGLYGSDSTLAAFYLFLYTLFGSLWIVLSISVIYIQYGILDFSLINYSSLGGSIWALGFIIAIAIKTPLVPFHSWLIKAHTQAPSAGSIILAGIVLKLATYAVLRLLPIFSSDIVNYISPIVYIFAVLSILYASLACLRQVDFKCIVAYSSIAHIGIVHIGLFSNNHLGISGAILLAWAHGLVSPALFYIVGSIIYNRYHSRDIAYYHNLSSYIPITISLFLIFTLGNLGFPLTLNWIGEFTILIAAFSVSPLIAALSALSIFLSASYSIWLFNRIAFGPDSSYIIPSLDISFKEFNVCFTLLIPLIAFGVFPNIILHDIQAASLFLLYSV